MPSSGICVDASLIVGLAANPQRERLRALWKGWQETRTSIVAPSLLLFEVTNAVFQYERQSMIKSSSADRFLRMAYSLPVRLYADADLHREAIRFSRRFALRATYDAHYLALAERLGAEFWTTDRRLVRAVEGELDWVQLAA